MKFEYFESLSAAEADEFLHHYITIESKAVEELRSEAERNGIDAGLTLASIPPVFLWVAERVRTLPQQPDPALPWWIRDSESYKASLFELDEPSKGLLMRASYYLGESFVRESATLSWGKGRRDTAVQNMPVVDGFTKHMQLPPILVTENLLTDIISGEQPPDIVARTVDVWRSFIEET